MRRLIGGLVGGGVAIFAGANAMDDGTKRNESGEIVESGGLGVLAIDVGDCIQLPTDTTEVISVEGVPCDEPHDAQLFMEWDVPLDGQFPGDADLGDRALQGCLAYWPHLVGTTYETDTELELRYLTPNAAGWAAGDREVQCMIVSLDGTPLIGDRLP